jgi:serine/threonine protein kinase
LLYLNLEENIKIARNEIKMLKYLNANEQDINEIIPKFYEYYEDNNDIWFSFEKGGNSLSSLSFKIKGEFENRERIYNIQKGIFLKYLFSNISQFKLFIRKILSGIDFINSKSIIHSDIKPENILIEYKGDSNEKNFEITSIKIIDFGSAFLANNTAAVTSNTPEYLCPEITNSNKKFIKELKNNNMKYINCIDIWSLGITILELCLCCPIWMNYKTKVIINGKIYHSSGLFGCRGRDAGKIYQKQVELSKNFQKKLKNSMIYMFEQKDRDNFIDLLKKMLELDYKKRITCQDAIKHPFFND